MSRRAIEVTPIASRMIKELLRARNKEYLKIGVKNRGCNGMTYTMNYAEECEYKKFDELVETCLLYTSPSPRDKRQSRMPSSA